MIYSNCRTIPKDYLPEWFISASKTCLLPNLYYNGQKAERTESNDYDLEPNAEKKKNNLKFEEQERQKLIKGNIKSSSYVKGGLFTCSFIAKSQDCIKAYIYWNGQMSRFGASV